MVLQNKEYNEERSLYQIHNVKIEGCKFISDIGESPIKEAHSLDVINTTFSMRYPFWHNHDVNIDGCVLDDKTRAPLWYDNNITIKNTKINGPKALRESRKITIDNSDITSQEFCWNVNTITISNSSIGGEYMFLNNQCVVINSCQINGKYSFQYVKNAKINQSTFDTKDAFWHSENITVCNSVIKGEYLGWYSKNLHLINCKIIGTQPLCYCEGLVLENCEMIDCDLAFEYSDVKATINSSILSVKNPIKGFIKAKKIDKVIFDEFRRDKGNFKITQEE